MFLLLLTACSLVSGPHTALEAARDAITRHDLAAFEAVVDLEAVGPGALQLCFAGATREGALEREFNGGNVFQDMLPSVSDALVLAASENNGPQIAEQLRKEFATLDPAKRCPNVIIQEPGTKALFDARRSGSLELPLLVAGVPVTVPLTFAEVNGVWKVTSMDAASTLKTLDTALAAEAHKRALELIDRVKKGGDPTSWAGLRHYTARHPEDAEVARAFEAAVAPLIAARTPIAVQTSEMAEAGILGMKRQLRAVVKNEESRGAASYTVRFQLLDSQGRPVSGNSGQDAVVGEGGALKAGESGEIKVTLHTLNFPGVAQVVASVTKVTFEDGKTWVHPAVEAGLW